MLQREAEQLAVGLYTLAKEKSYVLEKIRGCLICYLSSGRDEYEGYTEVFLYDLIYKKVLFYDLYVPDGKLIDILTGYLI